MNSHIKPLSDSIDHRTLSSMVTAGATIEPNVIGRAGEWGVVIRDGDASQTLAAAGRSAQALSQ